MEQSNPYLIEKILKKLKELTKFKEEKTSLLSESIAHNLKKLCEMKNYINENIPDNESKIFFEIGKYLKYCKYQKGQFIKHSYDLDNFFYIIFSGDIAKIDIKYNRLYLSFKEYLTHLIKLRLLGENHIYLKCIKKNQKVFPFDENMDILTTTNIKIDHYPELIKQIKKNINNSNWLTNEEKNNNIEDFFKLYNPEILNNKAAFIGKETKYPAYLPFYVFDKIMNPISFIGLLTKPKGIRLIPSYVCLNTSDIFYIKKTEIKENSNLFKLIQRRISENIIKVIFEGHFMFKDTDKSFLIRNYSKYFYVQKFIKGKKLIKQNFPYEGIFFIKSGLFQIKTFRSYNELTDLHYSILHALDNFPKALIDFQSRINDFDKKNRKIDNKNIFEGLDQNQIEKFTERKNILFNVFSPHDVVGLNDIYDSKTGLNNFTVECISNEAEVYFLPKEMVTNMMTDENINSKTSDFIGKHCLLFINEIYKYKESFVKGLQFEINNQNENNNSLYLSLKNISNMNSESHNKSLLNLKIKSKRNNSSRYSNFSNNNSYFSTSKNNNMSNYFFKTFNANKVANKSQFINNKNRYEKYPSIFLNNKINESDPRIKLSNDILNIDRKFDHKYSSNLNFYNKIFKNNIKLKNHISILHNNFLTDSNIFNKHKVINEEKKNGFSSFKNKFNSNIFINNLDENKVLFNKSYNKIILKKYKSQNKKNKIFTEYNNYENNTNSFKRPFSIIKNTLSKKKLFNDKKYSTQNIVQK